MTATVSDLIARLNGMGYAIYLDGDKVKFRYIGEGEPSSDARPLLAALREHKQEVMSILKGALPRPYLEADWGLVIPFGSDRLYHWWAGGQSISETINEIKGAANA